MHQLASKTTEPSAMKIMRHNITNLEIPEGVDICGKGFDINSTLGCPLRQQLWVMNTLSSRNNLLP